MKLFLTDKSIDKIDAAVLILLQYQDQIPFKGATEVVDWRLNGLFSHFIEDNHFAGKAREVLLIPAEKRIKAKQIVVLGLGNREEFEEIYVSQVIDFIFKMLIQKKENEFCFSLSQMLPYGFEWRNAVRLLLSQWLDHPEITRIVLSEPSECLNEARRRNMDFGSSVYIVFE